MGIDEQTELVNQEKKKERQGKTRAQNKEQVFQDFLIDMFASQKPHGLVNRIQFDDDLVSENMKREFATERKEKTLYD